jgi:hypothetical protein
MDYTKLTDEQLNNLHYDLTKEIWDNKLSGYALMQNRQICFKLQKICKERLKDRK